MIRLLVALCCVLALAGPAAAADNQGEELLQCVTVKWNAGRTYPPSVRVEVWVFAKAVAQGVLDLEHGGLDFDYEDGFVLARGRVEASFKPLEGKGELRLAALEASCDLSGAFPVKPRKLADIAFETKFDY
ncbi:hypothetical protein [Desulfocurvus sp. DL9XJH121]